MAFIPKPNTGTIWPNDRKTTDNQPDVKGDVHLEPALLKALLAKPNDGLIKMAIAGWKKDINGRKVLSITASEPYVKPEDTDLPY